MKIDEINKQLKIYINESSFISMKCRNQLLKIFSDEFLVDLDIGNYKNVDLSIQDDLTIRYREDTYQSDEPIQGIQDLENRFKSFSEKADLLIKRQEIDFKNKSNFNNISNLLIIVVLLLIMIGIILLVIHAFLSKNYFDCLWLIIFIIPWIIPKLKDNLYSRIDQAKRYIKGLFKKVK